jgi:hypothetical protein
MPGIDERIADLSHGASVWVVLAVAAALGVRHATDPDHLAAVANLIAGDRSGGSRSARVLGLAWGGGHALSLLALGVPLVLVGAYLPAVFGRAAEAMVGALIVALSLRVLLHARRGWHRHEHAHENGGPVHVHLHSTHDEAHLHRHPAVRVRTRGGAFAIGLLHGAAGSAGVGVLLLASIPSRAVALLALLLFGTFAAVSMALLSSGLVAALAAGCAAHVQRLALVALALPSLAFGVYYEITAFMGLPVEWFAM